MGSRLSLARSSTSSQLSREQQDYLNASDIDSTSSFHTSQTSFGAPGAVVEVEAPKQTQIESHVASEIKQKKHTPALRSVSCPILKKNHFHLSICRSVVTSHRMPVNVWAWVSVANAPCVSVETRSAFPSTRPWRCLVLPHMTPIVLLSKEQATMSATLGNRSGKLADLVKCPKGENPDEWIAVNTFLFYEVILEEILWTTCSPNIAGRRPIVRVLQGHLHRGKVSADVGWTQVQVSLDGRKAVQETYFLLCTKVNSAHFKRLLSYYRSKNNQRTYNIIQTRCCSHRQSISWIIIFCFHFAVIVQLKHLFFETPVLKGWSYQLIFHYFFI